MTPEERDRPAPQQEANPAIKELMDKIIASGKHLQELTDNQEDPSEAIAVFDPNVPEGCPPFDVIHLKLKNAMGTEVELRMTPDEALLVANNLIGACMDCMFADPEFSKKYVDSRPKWVAEQKAKEKSL